MSIYPDPDSKNYVSTHDQRTYEYSLDSDENATDRIKFIYSQN